MKNIKKGTKARTMLRETPSIVASKRYDTLEKMLSGSLGGVNTNQMGAAIGPKTGGIAPRNHALPPLSLAFFSAWCGKTASKCSSLRNIST
jgi:hypothetical protein